MRHSLIVLAAAALVVSAAPAAATTDDESWLRDDGSDSMRDLVEELAREENDGELPDTVDVRVNGGSWQTMAADEAFDRILEVSPTDANPNPLVPAAVQAPIVDGGASHGPTGSACQPASISNVVNSGSPGADITTSGENNGPADCLGLPQQGPVSNATVEIVDDSAVRSTILNNMPGWVEGGNCGGGIGHCNDWALADHLTAHCTVTIEFSFFGIYFQQLGVGMPGCGTGDVTSAVTLR